MAKSSLSQKEGASLEGFAAADNVRDTVRRIALLDTTQEIVCAVESDLETKAFEEVPGFRSVFLDEAPQFAEDPNSASSQETFRISALSVLGVLVRSVVIVVVVVVFVNRVAGSIIDGGIAIGTLFDMTKILATVVASKAFTSIGQRSDHYVGVAAALAISGKQSVVVVSANESSAGECQEESEEGKTKELHVSDNSVVLVNGGSLRCLVFAFENV